MEVFPLILQQDRLKYTKLLVLSSFIPLASSMTRLLSRLLHFTASFKLVRCCNRSNNVVMPLLEEEEEEEIVMSRSCSEDNSSIPLVRCKALSTLN